MLFGAIKFGLGAKKTKSPNLSRQSTLRRDQQVLADRQAMYHHRENAYHHLEKRNEAGLDLLRRNPQTRTIAINNYFKGRLKKEYPHEYAQHLKSIASPSPGQFIKSGTEMLRSTPDVVKVMNQHSRAVSQYEKSKLAEARYSEGKMQQLFEKDRNAQKVDGDQFYDAFESVEQKNKAFQKYQNSVDLPDPNHLRIQVFGPTSRDIQQAREAVIANIQSRFQAGWQDIKNTASAGAKAEFSNKWQQLDLSPGGILRSWWQGG